MREEPERGPTGLAGPTWTRFGVGSDQQERSLPGVRWLSGGQPGILCSLSLIPGAWLDAGHGQRCSVSVCSAGCSSLHGGHRPILSFQPLTERLLTHRAGATGAQLGVGTGDGKMEGGQGRWVGVPGGLCVRVREGQAWAGGGRVEPAALGWDLSSPPLGIAVPSGRGLKLFGLSFPTCSMGC